MRIAIATAVYYPMINGVANFAHNLAVGLAKRGLEVLVITPSQNGKSYKEIVDGVEVVYLRSMQVKIYPDQIHETGDDGYKAQLEVTKEEGKLKKTWRKGWHFPWYRHGFRVSVFPSFEVKRVLDEFRPDVVHVQVSDPIGLSVVGYARKRRIPVVTTEHNQPEVLTASFHLGLLRRPVNYLLASYFRNRQRQSDFVTMPTEKAIYDLLAGHKELGVPIAAVSNGVELTHFRPGRAGAEIYRKYGLAQDERYILYVGRVDPEKKVGEVIEAFCLAAKMMEGRAIKGRSGKEARPKLPKLLIVGDGTDRAKLEKKAARLGESVRFLGKVLPPELYEIYRVGDLFVTASPIETQGIVLIEAAATGLPLIAVDKGAVSEVCRDGENGYLCRPEDVKEMAEAIAKIMSEQTLRQRFAQKSIEIAREHDMKKTLDKFINIYQRAIEEKKKD